MHELAIAESIIGILKEQTSSALGGSGGVKSQRDFLPR